MKKNVSSETKANMATGMSSAFGAAAGVMAGSMVTDELHAAEVVNVPIEENVTQEEVTPEVVTPNNEDVISNEEHNTDNTDVVVVTDGSSTPEPPEEINVGSVINEEPQIQVISYETGQLEDGSIVDAALVNIDGQDVAFIDLDRDGIADVALSDLNGNGMLDEGEVADIEEQGILMQPFEDAASANDGHLMAQTADLDYVNDANVDEYYA